MKKVLTIGIVILLVLFVLRIQTFFFSPKNSRASSAPTPQARTKYSTSMFKGIQKHEEILADQIEATPFVWKGKLKYFISERTVDGRDHRLALYDFETREHISTFGEGFGMGSAFVHNDKLYIFADKNWGARGKSELYMFESSDLKTFSKPIKIYSAPQDQGFFNTSVTYDSDRKIFVMALETEEKDYVAFSIRFFESPDLKEWTLVPDMIFGRDIYVACPAIRYINGEYYMWYLSEERNFPTCKECVRYVERLAKSKDLRDWTVSPHYFLVPDQEDEGINTSDIDLTEYDNKVYMLFMVGDQATWANLKYATYDGSMAEMVRHFF